MRRVYRPAVKAISKGRVSDGFRWLARSGGVVEQPIEDCYRAMADEFLAIHARGKSCLVVSPTWREIGLVSDPIRSGLISRGARERSFGTGRTGKPQSDGGPENRWTFPFRAGLPTGL
jgi:hypothetical protein